MDKLNICLVSLGISPDKQDGETKFFRGIFDYLKKQGHNIVFLTGKWNIKLPDPNIVQFNLINKRFLWIPQFNIKVIKYLRSHNFDIIHGNGPKGTFPIIFSKTKRFISTFHDLGPFETKFTKFPFKKYLIKFITEKSTYITTCSNTIRKELNYYIPKLNINNIYNLYSAIEDKFKPHTDEAIKLKDKLNIEGPVLLFLGRITSYKGVEDVISAYRLAKKKIHNLNLIIGGIPDFFMEKTYNKWRRKNKDIHFVGYVPEKEIPFYYTMADIFITYSYASEGFGLTPIEAIACGTPVICSSILPYREILEDNAIFVPPKSPTLIANKIIYLLENDDIRKKILNKAQTFIKKYTWDEVGKRLEKVYQKFLDL
jgi:glycosyltransferase involved in cell wall biosynthesis